MPGKTVHPVLDRSPALRDAADRARFTSPARRWLGWHVGHRFTYASGHTFSAAPAQLLSGRLHCSRCEAQAHLDTLRQLAEQAGVKCTRACHQSLG